MKFNCFLHKKNGHRRVLEFITCRKWYDCSVIEERVPLIVYLLVVINSHKFVTFKNFSHVTYRESFTPKNCVKVYISSYTSYRPLTQQCGVALASLWRQ